MMSNPLDKLIAPNPFTSKSGKVVNPYIDYQRLLDSDKVNSKTKNFITQATGLTSTVKPKEKNILDSYSPDVISGNTPKFTVGQRVANTSTYNNSAAKGQCVWYARGRASEKLGVDTGAIGNANEMWYNAKADSRLAPAASNIKPNTLLSFEQGTSSGGKKYGHVIYIEDVVGDTVYYTEGGSGYHKNGTDGIVKTATKEGILNGVNASGARIGSNAIGLIDLTKY